MQITDSYLVLFLGVDLWPIRTKDVLELLVTRYLIGVQFDWLNTEFTVLVGAALKVCRPCRVIFSTEHLEETHVSMGSSSTKAWSR